MSFPQTLGGISAALILSMLVPAPARGGELEVSPILVELEAGRRTSLLSVRNGSQGRMRYQIRAFSWAQDLDGKMQLDPTSDVVVFPPLLELAPGEARKIRIGTSAVPGPQERSYRVFIEEMPFAETPGAGPQVRVLTRVGIPLFVSPQRVDSRGEVAILSVGGGRMSFTVRNTGTVRLRPTAIEVSGIGPDGENTFTTPVDPWYVLARGERHYEAELPKESCGRTREVRALVRVDPAPFVATVMLPDGACAR
jgi:fimbrial chaperone protein